MSWANRIKSLVVASAIASSAVLLLAAKTSAPGLDGVRERGELVIALRASPTSWYTNSFGDAGFEYELASRFAREQGVPLRVLPVHGAGEALEAVTRGKADLAGGMALSTATVDQQRFIASLPVQQLGQLVVCESGQGQPLPSRMGDLAGRALVVSAGSPQAAYLAALSTQVPGLNWEEIKEASEENLLGLVHEDLPECALIDSDAWAFHRHLYPDLKVAQELPGATFYGWVFARTTDSTLRDAANAWLAMRQADGSIAALRDRQYAHLDSLTSIDGRHFYRAMQTRLPRYVAAFRAEAERNGLDWRLLAAVSYQESLWDPSAQSPTGVQGLMQLTRDTASHVGIADRTDPLASIQGGARYLRQILDALPEDIPAADRTWMALAAYNAGLAHLLDARTLTRKRGGNPDKWEDVRANLALLKQEQWYTQTRYGYAHGATQAIVYVRHVRRYYDLLVLASNSSMHGERMLASHHAAAALAAN